MTKGGSGDGPVREAVLVTGSPTRIRDALGGFEILALAFRGHNLMLEIQVKLYFMRPLKLETIR